MSESEMNTNKTQSLSQMNDVTLFNPKHYPKKSKHELIYGRILEDIRDMKVLSNYQLYYLRTPRISRCNLLEIVELYNSVIRNVNEIV